MVVRCVSFLPSLFLGRKEMMLHLGKLTGNSQLPHAGTQGSIGPNMRDVLPQPAQGGVDAESAQSANAETVKSCW